MKSMKYLPSVSTFNSFKLFRQLINNSLQKINSIDVNPILDKYLFSNTEDSKKKTNIDTKAEIKSSEKSIDVKTIEWSQKSSKHLKDNKSLIEEENKLFESALNEWIELRNHPGDIRGDIDREGHPSVPEPKTPTKDVSTPSDIYKPNVELRTKQLLQSMSHSDSVINTKRRLQEFSKLLVTYPEAVNFAVKQNAIQKVLRLNHWSKDQVIRQQSSQALSLLGYTSPPKGSGIRILSIDGGGIDSFVLVV